jgi:DNA-binding CsgD family transcriptional regulator
MSPVAGALLVNKIMPIIMAMVPQVVKPVEPDDTEELVQDTVAQAARMLHSAEEQGKTVHPSGIAYFAIQRAKSGRRSTGGGRVDALCPAARLDGHVAISYLDAELPCGHEDDGSMSLHDVLAAPQEDPAQEAARSLDWGALMGTLDSRERSLVRALVKGDKQQALARRFGVNPATITQLKRKLARRVREQWGEDVFTDIACKPRWHASLAVNTERDAARHNRALAQQAVA